MFVLSFRVEQKNEHRTSNVERPTSNNEFCQFIKDLVKRIYLLKFVADRGFCSFLMVKIGLSAASSILDVRCWTFDVRRSSVSFLIYLAVFQASGWADPPPAENLTPDT